MCQAVLSPNLAKKFRWEVSQIADNRFPCVMLLGGLSVNLNHLKMTNLWMLVTSLIMVQFSIRKKFWKALDLLYQTMVKMTGNNEGNNGNDGETTVTSVAIRSWKMTNLWMPVTSLIMVWFSIRKKFWKALDLLYQVTVETTRKQWKQRKWWEKQQKWWGPLQLLLEVEKWPIFECL